MQLLSELIALIAPPGCAACRRPLADPRAVVCGDCLRAVPWLLGGCARCGLPRHGAERPCPGTQSALARAWAPVAYEGVARRLVAGFKYGGLHPVAGLLAAQIVANLPSDLRRADARLVPVPPHARRLRARGHDPTRALALAVSRRTGLALSPCLCRVDRSSRQVGSGRRARTASGRIDIRVAGPVPERVLLVDDVHTTGATLEACAVALRSGGAGWVGAVTYARAG